MKNKKPRSRGRPGSLKKGRRSEKKQDLHTHKNKSRCNPTNRGGPSAHKQLYNFSPRLRETGSRMWVGEKKMFGGASAASPVFFKGNSAFSLLIFRLAAPRKSRLSRSFHGLTTWLTGPRLHLCHGHTHTHDDDASPRTLTPTLSRRVWIPTSTFARVQVSVIKLQQVSREDFLLGECESACKAQRAALSHHAATSA